MQSSSRGPSAKSGRAVHELYEIRTMVAQVINDEETFAESVRATFMQFDFDNSGTLDFNETKLLITKLCTNLQVPAPPDSSLIDIFNIYDDDKNGALSQAQFSSLYRTLLLRIKDRYYPEKQVYINRGAFISRIQIENDIHKRLEFVRCLGKGQFGTAHLVREKTSCLTRVCKTISKKEFKMSHLWEAEIQVMKKLDHMNVIKVYEVYEDERNLYIIMETCSGGELQDLIQNARKRGKKLNEIYISDIMRQLFCAVNYLHRSKVAHRDLKPANILFQGQPEDPHVKVIDFGLADIFQSTDDTISTIKGTGLYWAPEVYKMKSGLKSDIWSCGVIMWNLLTEGSMPFFANTREQLQRKVLQTSPDWKELSHVSETAIEFLKLLLEKDAEKRPTAKQCLLHPWLQQSMKRIKGIVVPNSILTNLMKFTKMDAIKRAIVLMMAHQLNSDGRQMKAITDLYLALDRRGSGQLDFDAFSMGLTRLGVPQYETNRIFQAIDLDGSMRITYTEFVSACYTWRVSDETIIRTAFSKLDPKNTGFITPDMLVDVFMAVEIPQQATISTQQNEQLLRDSITAIDTNRNGIIDWDEFYEYIQTSM